MADACLTRRGNSASACLRCGAREPLGVPQTAWNVVLINATLDLSGNFFYILASKTGRLDISAILSSLYPGATVILAWLLLKEHISRWQVVGIMLALGAIGLFAI